MSLHYDTFEGLDSLPVEDSTLLRADELPGLQALRVLGEARDLVEVLEVQKLRIVPPNAAPGASSAAPAASGTGALSTDGLEEWQKYVIRSVCYGIQTLYGLHRQIAAISRLTPENAYSLAGADPGLLATYADAVLAVVSAIQGLTTKGPAGSIRVWMPERVHRSIRESQDPKLVAASTLIDQFQYADVYGVLLDDAYERLPQESLSPGVVPDPSSGRLVRNPKIAGYWQYVVAVLIGVAIGGAIYVGWRYSRAQLAQAAALNAYAQAIEEVTKCIMAGKCDPDSLKNLKPPDAPSDPGDWLSSVKGILIAGGAITVFIFLLPEIKGFFRLFKKTDF